MVAITYSLADYFARENPRFVRDRFYRAVGIDVNEPPVVEHLVVDGWDDFTGIGDYRTEVRHG